MAVLAQGQVQKQSQKQVQKISQLQIQALKFLAMNSQDLQDEVYKAVSENPALEIVRKKSDSKKITDSGSSQTLDSSGDYRNSFDSANYDDFNSSSSSFDSSFDYQDFGRRGSFSDSDSFQQTLEAQADSSETLQSHLMHQINSMKLSSFEYELSQKLIYNLDKNGFYGSMIAPESFLPSKSVKNQQILQKCIERIQKMDPVGTCCKTPEESLFVQAKIDPTAPKIALFILDGHLELMNPPEVRSVYARIKKFQEEYHKKSFASKLILDSLNYDEFDVEEAVEYILQLNPHPAQGYTKDTVSKFEQPDIVLTVEKKVGPIFEDDFGRGLVCGDENCHFQVKYASGNLPDLKISQEFSMDKENVSKAQLLIQSLKFRESTIVLQGCAIVRAQKDFFLYGKGHLCAYTHRQLAEELQIHESTVSRMANKKVSKYIQTEWGLFPANYFFSSGVKTSDGSKKVSSEAIVQMIREIFEENQLSGVSNSESESVFTEKSTSDEKSVSKKNNKNLSDSKLAELLNERGIKIARRTVAKYRIQAGIRNSYER